MSSEEDIKQMVEDTVKEFGKIDILVNNAGTAAGFGKIHEINTDEWDFNINVNLRGPFLCMKYTIPYMLENKGGSIINISSVASIRAEVPEIGTASYGASKAAINNLTQVSAMHYAKDNIRINAIAPGMHKSEIGRAGNTEEQNKEMDKFLDDYCAEWIPMGRIAEAEELSGLVLLLASNASSYITGQIICQDGGKKQQGSKDSKTQRAECIGQYRKHLCPACFALYTLRYTKNDSYYFNSSHSVAASTDSNASTVTPLSRYSFIDALELCIRGHFDGESGMLTLIAFLFTLVPDLYFDRQSNAVY